MGDSPYVLVNVQGTDADGLYCVKSKYPELPTMVYDPIEDDSEVVRVVVDVSYVDEGFEEVVVRSLPVSFNTTKLYVLGGETAKPDQAFCKAFLDRHGVRGVAAVNLGQSQARLQEAEALQYGEPNQQPGPRRRIRVGQSQAQSHKRARDSHSEVQSEGLSTRTRSRSLSRTPHNVEDGPSEMKDTIQTWAASHLLSMAAKFKQISGKELDDLAKSQLTQQRDALTSQWSEENCHGQAAILTIKAVATFYEASLLLAYGQQNNEHLRLVLDEEMSSMIEHVKEAGDAPKLQVLFKEFKKKLADFTGKAIEAQKESKHGKLRETQSTEQRDFLKGLQSMLATSPAARQRNVATSNSRSSFNPLDACKFWTGAPNSCNRGPNCMWKATHIPNKTGAEAAALLKSQA
ncbi:TPA: hypothetical protein ACH3X2_001785 [Trebouxia sp. C0005]